MAASKQKVIPPSYRETLDGADKVQYDEKLRLVGNEDPHPSIRRIGQTM